VSSRDPVMLPIMSRALGSRVQYM